MSLPIQPTPVLEGEDADLLLTQLEDVCSPAEAQARIDWAKEELLRIRPRSPRVT